MMVNYTSSLPEETFERLTKMSKDLKVPKNEIINKALTDYLISIEKKMFAASFKALANDGEQLAIAEEGMEGYNKILKDYE